MRDFLYRKEDRAFCFKVKHQEGRSLLQCVDRAVKETPKVSEVREGKELTLIMAEEGVYRVYKFKEHIIPKRVGEFKGTLVKLKREYSPYRVAITKVAGSVESEPLLVDVPPIEPPAPPPPERVRILRKGDKLYIYWSYPAQENVRFEVYRNGKLVTPEPILQNLYVDPIPSEEITYEVRAVNEFGVKSASVKVIYRP